MNLKIFQIRLDTDYLDIDQAAVNAFMEGNKIEKTSTQFVPGDPDYWSILVFYEIEKQQLPKPREYTPQDVASFVTGTTPDEELDANERSILSALKSWRRDKASALNVPDFMILHNAELVNVAKTKPTTIAELSGIKGFGAQKVARHGDEVISIINAF